MLRHICTDQFSDWPKKVKTHSLLPLHHVCIKDRPWCALTNSFSIVSQMLSFIHIGPLLELSTVGREFPPGCNKKAQLSLTNARDAKACQKLLHFDVLTTLSLTILAYLHSFSCCCVRNVRNPEKFTENSSLWSPRSSKVIDLRVNRKPICDLLLVINSNFSRICCRFRDIHG